jgi:N-methylhydantoinase B
MLDPETKMPDRQGSYFYSFRVPVWRTRPHTIFRYITNGGGGWGDPMTRDPERVKKDVRDEYISIQGARRDYGVVIEGDPANDPENLTVNLKETQKLRHARK